MRKLFIAVFILLSIAIVISCGEKKPEISKDKLAEFQKYEYGKFILYFSPRSGFINQKAELARAYQSFMVQLCDILEMPVPEDKITMYIYRDMVESRALVGKDTPFSNDNEIHWGSMYPYGYQLTKFLLHKKGMDPGQFDVVNEGIPHLLDFSGVNYHDKTNRLVNSGQFIPLARLGDNQLFDSLAFGLKRAEAASLMGYLMYQYGVTRLSMLMESSASWEKSLQSIYQTPIDELEKNWLAFALQMADNPQGTVENDTVKDLETKIQ